MMTHLKTTHRRISISLRCMEQIRSSKMPSETQSRGEDFFTPIVSPKIDWTSFRPLHQLYSSFSVGTITYVYYRRYLTPWLSIISQYIAQMLLSINERGAYQDPPPSDILMREKQDEEIFQTARLINCGHFKSIVVSDFLSAIAGSGFSPNVSLL